jgi:hypothetical protein
VSENRSTVLRVRVTEAEHERYAEAAGGNLSAWMRGALAEAANGGAPPPPEPAPSDREPDERAAWIKRRAMQLTHQGRTSPMAVREAQAEWEARAGA